MVTSEIIEALELFEGLLRDDAQRQAVLAAKEMLCEWTENEWMRMDDSEKRKWLHSFLPVQSDNT